MKFKIVEAESAEGLSKKIEALMNEGWKRDGPFQTRDWTANKSSHPSYWQEVTTYFQPMIHE